MFIFIHAGIRTVLFVSCLSQISWSRTFSPKILIWTPWIESLRLCEISRPSEHLLPPHIWPLCSCFCVFVILLVVVVVFLLWYKIVRTTTTTTTTTTMTTTTTTPITTTSTTTTILLQLYYYNYYYSYYHHQWCWKKHLYPCTSSCSSSCSCSSIVVVVVVVVVFFFELATNLPCCSLRRPLRQCSLLLGAGAARVESFNAPT